MSRALSLLRVVGIGARMVAVPDQNPRTPLTKPDEVQADLTASYRLLQKVEDVTLYYEQQDQEQRAKLAQMERERIRKGGTPS